LIVFVKIKIGFSRWSNCPVGALILKLSELTSLYVLSMRVLCPYFRERKKYALELILSGVA